MKPIYLFMLTAITGALVSCGGEEVDPNNYDVPSTYEFIDDSGKSTVSYSGQTTRLNQLGEITTYMKSANTPGVALSAEQLLEMYSNNDGQGSSFFSDDANGVDKQLKNKTARGDANYTAIYENYFTEMAAASATTVEGQYNGAPGQAGVIQSGEKAYLVNENGLEYTQIIEKGLMGAVFYDQIQNVYLGEEKLNVDNTEAVDPENGKFYTVMEHHWDEAYGYFTSATDFPTNGTDRFWGKYSNTVDALLNTNETIASAFRTGRAALSNDDLDTRDDQIVIIRTELERVCAGTAIHYLNGSIANFTDNAVRTHELSEAAAFLEGLYFSSPHTTRLTASQITEITDLLKNESGDYDFYNVTVQDLTQARDLLSSHMGFDDVKTEL